MIRSRALYGIAIAAALTICTNWAAATPQPAPEGGPLKAFQAYDATSETRIGDGLWASILAAAIDPDQPKRHIRLNYTKLGPGAHEALLSYLGTLQKLPVSSLNRDEQLAYWLNFYNAANLSFVTSEFARLIRKRRFQNRSTSAWSSTGTIRLRVKKFYLGDKSPWADRRFTVEGEHLSLNDIEHRILYPIWKDSLVTYGLNCPARGCPPLSDIPYTGERVRAQLAEAAKWFADNQDAEFNWRLNGKAPRKGGPVLQTGREIFSPTSQGGQGQ